MWRTPDRTQGARRLRQEMTKAEAVLWTMVRGRRLAGLKFRRQEPVAGAVCDFVCLEARLVVELDGGVHRLHVDRDEARDASLRQAGFSVLRWPNEAFLANPNPLLEAIRKHAGNPSPRGEKVGRGATRMRGLASADERKAAKPPGLVFRMIRRHAAGMRRLPPHPTGSAGHLLPRGEKENGRGTAR